MKGPHFFEKRKKEMARQEKAKQKAERKAQRKAGKDRGEGGEGVEGDEASDEAGESADLRDEAATLSSETETGSGTSVEEAPRGAADSGERES